MFPEKLSKEEFLEFVDSIENKDKFKDKKEVLKKLEALLSKSVKKRAKGKVSIAFSGGLDSTSIALICEKLKIKFKLYAVGLQDSKDLDFALKIAARRKWNLELKILTLDEVEDIINNLAKIIPNADVVNIGVGTVVYAVGMIARGRILNGLGSEEIFGGYERHLKADNVNEECLRGLKEVFWKRDIERDRAIAEALNMEVFCPFLDDELIGYAMKVNGKLKVKDGFRKHILAELAKNLGLEEEFAFRKKLATQYGSSVDKAVERIAKKKGMKKGKYIESLKVNP